jgi:hypothetical protein
MKLNKILYRSSVLAGILLILAGVARSLSVNNLLIAIETGDISRPFAASVLIDGVFSSLLLLLMGIWILFLSGDLRKLQRKAFNQVLLIGLFLILFGAFFWYKYPRSFHLAFFLLVGLLLFLPGLLARKHSKK